MNLSTELLNAVLELSIVMLELICLLGLLTAGAISSFHR